jgi:hypothetical protein
MGMKRLEECSVLCANVSMSQLSCRISSVAAEAAIALEITCLERQFREVQMELAHANRVATMGQFWCRCVRRGSRITERLTQFNNIKLAYIATLRDVLNRICSMPRATPVRATGLRARSALTKATGEHHDVIQSCCFGVVVGDGQYASKASRR